MRQHTGTVDVKFILDGDIVAQNGNVFDSSPSSDGGVPTNDGRLDPGVISDSSVGHDNASLETGSRTNLGAWANDDVGTNKGSRVDFGSL